MKRNTAWDKKIPFNKKDGSVFHYVSAYEERVYGVDWRENYVFYATLTTKYAARGRSSAIIVMADDQGILYNVSLYDFMTIVPDLVKGAVTRNWTFKKTGQNFFCTPCP